jgi:hypothetical protein
MLAGKGMENHAYQQPISHRLALGPRSREAWRVPIVLCVVLVPLVTLYLLLGWRLVMSLSYLLIALTKQRPSCPKLLFFKPGVLRLRLAGIPLSTRDISLLGPIFAIF